MRIGRKYVLVDRRLLVLFTEAGIGWGDLVDLLVLGPTRLETCLEKEIKGQ